MKHSGLRWEGDPFAAFFAEVLSPARRLQLSQCAAVLSSGDAVALDSHDCPEGRPSDVASGVGDWKHILEHTH